MNTKRKKRILIKDEVEDGRLDHRIEREKDESHFE